MAKKEFAFEDKFKNEEMIEEAWEDPRDKARRERKLEEEKAKAELKAKEESEKKAAKAEVKEKPVKTKASSLFGERPKEIKPKFRINTYLDPEVGEYIERVAAEYHLSKNEVVNRMLKAAMELDK